MAGSVAQFLFVSMFVSMSAVWTGAPLKGRHIKLCQLLWLQFWKTKEKILLT